MENNAYTSRLWSKKEFRPPILVCVFGQDDASVEVQRFGKTQTETLSKDEWTLNEAEAAPEPKAPEPVNEPDSSSYNWSLYPWTPTPTP